MNKDFIFLILVLVIVFGILFWQNLDTVDFYFDKIKAGISPKLELSEDSGLDLSEINIESLLEEEPTLTEGPRLSSVESLSTGEEEDGIGGPLIGELLEMEETLEKEVVVLEKKLTLEEIEQKVNRVAKEVERIDKEVQILVALDKSQ